MKHILFSIFLLLLASFINVAAEDKKTKSTQEQLQGLEKAEQKYKDNPYALGIINQLKKNIDITDEEQQAPTPVEPVIQEVQPEIKQGSRSTADKAYAKGDYETAIEHYKALAKKGDTDASLILGTMYEQGKGTDIDKAAAHVWYKKSSEGGDVRGKELMNLIEDSSMSEEDMAEADKRYDEISGKSERPGSGEISQQTGATGQMTATGPEVHTYNRHSGMRMKEIKTDTGENKDKLLVKWTPFIPAKRTDIEYIKPVTVSISFQPDRFYRK